MNKGTFLKSMMITLTFFVISSAAVPGFASDYIAGDGATSNGYDSNTATTVGNTTIGENASTGAKESTAVGTSATAGA
ncbi:hypothetical protein NL523_27755, partial [Klebsiella pneumoniae]|nr:hypothetical protein [Klebsiella pneumoniae]MCP6663545.1 hypothetical protein [Klebsiella pneumoniae]